MLDTVELLPLLRCPISHQPLLLHGEFLRSQDGVYRYPLVGGIPILIARERSLFQPIDSAARPDRSAGRDGGGDGITEDASRRFVSARRRLARLVPSISRNQVARQNYDQLAALLEQMRPEAGGSKPVLIVGGGVAGEGMQSLLSAPSVEILETDVYIGARTRVVCDGHDLPFRDGSFRAVVCQAVLEHVIDAQRVVAEIHRVLADDGLVYSEIPFIQQVHEAPYDFQRFTLLGHRRLFHRFEAIRSGACGGPGMALAWSFRYFLMSFAGHSRAARAALSTVASFATFWLKYLDGHLVQRAAALDAAAGTFFLGRRQESVVADAEIIDAYRGGVQPWRVSARANPDWH